MSGGVTPNFGFELLEPSQAQPEVPLNFDWNLVDTLLAEAIGITVEEVGISPIVSEVSVKKLKFDGATVTPESDGAALITIAPSGTIDIVEIGGISPGETVTAKTVRFSGATVTPESDMVALVQIEGPSIQEIGGASPGETVQFNTLRVSGATIEPESSGDALMIIPQTIIVQEIGGDSPGVFATVAELRFCGATVQPESNGVAVITPTPPPIRATWTSAFGAITTPINDIPVYVDRDGILDEVIILTEGGAGSCTVNIWKAAMAAHYPPVIGDDITGGASPAIASGTTYDNAALTGWTRKFSRGDVVLFDLGSSGTFTFISITLRFR